MDKKIIAILVACCVAVGFVLFSTDVKMTNQITPSQNSEHSTKSSYQNSKLEVTSSTPTQNSSIIPPKPEPKVEPIRTQSIVAQDESDTYEIELIDEQKDLFEKTSYHKFEGSIDGNKFEIEIPEYLVEMGHKAKFNVRNKKTGDFNTVSANFHGGKIDINKEELTNQQVYNATIPQKITSGILPGVQ